jgi:2-oxoglutarate dehydrogenase E1 component
LSVSPLEALIKGRFDHVIDEVDPVDKAAITRLVFCAGKVYFDLLEARRSNSIANIAIARIEQLFPFPHKDVKAVIASYPNLKEVVWVQEEPKNQGSWYYMQSRGTMIGCLGEQHTFGYAGRHYFASPAVGSMTLHQKQQKQLVDDALALTKLEVTTHRKRA